MRTREEHGRFFSTERSLQSISREWVRRNADPQWHIKVAHAYRAIAKERTGYARRSFLRRALAALDTARLLLRKEAVRQLSLL